MITLVVLGAWASLTVLTRVRGFYAESIGDLNADIDRRGAADTARLPVDVDPAVAVDLLLWDLELAR